MQADQDDRHALGGQSSNPAALPIMLVAAVLVLGLGWYFLRPAPEPEAPPAAVTPQAPIVEPEPTPALPPTEPDIPEPEPAPAAPELPSESTEPEPVMSLDESDEPVQAMLAPMLSDSPLAPALDNNDLLLRAASLIDASSQGRAFPEVLKLPPPEGKFVVVQREGATYMDPANHQRYDAYAQAIAALDPQTLTDAFNAFRPLLEQAYASLGYRGEDMDNALVRALDQVIAAPVLQHPAQLKQDVTTWHYTDESLEELPSLTKLILRMGPENQALLQAQAKAIRTALLAPSAP